MILGIALFRGRSWTPMTFVGPFQYSIFYDSMTVFTGSGTDALCSCHPRLKR